MSLNRRNFLPLGFLFLLAGSICAEEKAKAVPPNTDQPDYLAVVRGYADAMVNQASGKYGEMKAPLFASCLDCKTLYFLTENTSAPKGVRGEDRVIRTGSNPQHDQALYLLLYELTRITGEKRYAQAADTSLKWFLTHAQSRKTGLYAWGEHMCWDIPANTWYCGRRDKANGIHELGDVWRLMDRSYQLAPENCMRFGLGLWEHQIGNHETGDFNRHAGYLEHEPGGREDYQRHAGFFIRAWADLYALTKDERFLQPIDVVLGHYERKRDPTTGIVPGGASVRGKDGAAFSSTLSSFKLAISCAESVPKVPEPLAGRLRAFAAREDEAFLRLPHFSTGSSPTTAGVPARGFLLRANAKDGKPWPPLDPDPDRPLSQGAFSSAWRTGYGSPTSADAAVECIERYRQTRNRGYRDLILKAAQSYMTGEMDTETYDVWPAVPANVIHVMIAAYRETGDRKYLGRAEYLGAQAVRLFWDDGPLPRASTRCAHYETITGGPDLALALLDLHETFASTVSSKGAEKEK